MNKEEKIKPRSELCSTTGVEKIIEEAEKYAKEKGFKLNPNEKIVEGVVKGLLANEKKYGFRYCPCRRLSGNKEEDKKKICPCAWHQEEIEKQGHCLCGLFAKPRSEPCSTTGVK